MKRFAAVITTGALMLALAACSVEVNNKETDKSEVSKEETTEASEEIDTEDTSETSASETTAEIAETNVICAWKDYAIDTLGIKDYINLFTWDGGPEDTQVMIYPDGDITNFSFYKLINLDVQQDGSFTYDKDLVDWEPSLEGNCGYLISVRIQGDLPEYGYSYVDQDGTTKEFVIEVSGEDGSIVTIQN